MSDNKHLRRGLALAYGALAVLALWIFMRYALRWLLPFFVAFAIARSIEKPVRWLNERLRLPRTLASGLCVALAFALLVTMLGLAIARSVVELTALARQLPSLLGDLTAALETLNLRLRELISSAPSELGGYIDSAIAALSSKGAEVLTGLSSGALNALGAFAQGSPRVFLFVFATALGTVFISASYGEIVAFLLRQIPMRHHEKAKTMRDGVKTTVGKWAKCQLFLMCITFAELLVLFFVMRIDFAILLAFGIALVDMLPALGVGIVLVPWGFAEMLGGDTQRAIALFVAFGIIVLVRNILEPKLLGSQLGLPPIVALAAMYVGFCAVGVLGMILLPIGAILIKQFNDKGILRLWK